MAQNGVIIFAFTYYYFGIIGFASYLISFLFSFKYKASYFDLFVLLIICAVLVGKLGNSNIWALIRVGRFFLGFFLFFLFFNSIRVRVDLQKLLLYLSVLTILEAVSINSFIDPVQMPNYPIVNNKMSPSAMTSYFSFFQRPYSFGGSPTVTAGILMSLLSISNPKKLVVRFTAIVAVIISASGLGYLLLFSYLVFRRPILGVIVLSIIILYSFRIAYGDSLFVKIDPRRVMYLINLKVASLNVMISTNSYFEYLFGTGVYLKSGSLSYGGDSAMISFVYSFGLIIVSAVFIFIASKMHRYNAEAIIFLVIGSFHYGVMFYLPGQVLLGLLLSSSYREWHLAEKNLRVKRVGLS